MPATHSSVHDVAGLNLETEHLAPPAPCLQMRSSPKDSRMAPSVHAFTAAMRAASEGGRWEAALSVWDDMQAAGCKPTGGLELWVPRCSSCTFAVLKFQSLHRT